MSDRYDISRKIVRHSCDIIRQHPKLLVFTGINAVAILPAVVLFFAPLVLDASPTELWQALWNPEATDNPRLASMSAADEAFDGVWSNGLLLGELLGLYLLGTFAMTFVNMALFSQIIEAMNGNRVSISQGFKIANERLPAIFAWSLLAGTVGMILRAIGERFGFVGKWVVGLVGMSWSAASVFVIPVMINEAGSRNPFSNLRLSTALIKRVWGEGVIGYINLSLSLAFKMFIICFPLLMIVHITDSFRLAFVFGLLLGALGMAFNVLVQIFQCGLYVYATQGVAPGSYDAEIFDRSWSVR